MFGGVVPEIASRAAPHGDRAGRRRARWRTRGTTLDDVDAVAVTYAPGLVGALLVGVSFAKAIAFGRGIPCLGVHHMEGHLFATALEHRDAVPPFTALLVSGGHTMLVDVPAWGRYRTARPHARRRRGRGVRQGREAARASVSRRPAHRAARGDGRPGAIALRAADGAPRPAARRCGLLRRLVQRPQDRGAATRCARGDGIERHARTSRAPSRMRRSKRSSRRRRARPSSYGRKRVVLGGGVACNRALVAAMRAAREATGRRRCSRRRRVSRRTTPR